MKTRLLALALALAFLRPAAAGPTVSGDGACGVRAIDNASFVTCDGDRAPDAVFPEEIGGVGLPAAMSLSAAQAWQIRKDLGRRVLVVEIRSPAETGGAARPFGADAAVMLSDPPRDASDGGRDGPDATPGRGFLATLDERLRAAGLDFGDPVILLCRRRSCGAGTAELMRAHGYLQVFAVTDGFEAWNVAGGYGRADRP